MKSTMEFAVTDWVFNVMLRPAPAEDGKSFVALRKLTIEYTVTAPF